MLCELRVGCGSGGPSQAFTWLLTLSTVAGLIAWGMSDVFCMRHATNKFCFLNQ